MLLRSEGKQWYHRRVKSEQKACAKDVPPALKLEPGTGAVPVLVIDHAEKPSGN
jgi:hypothetical protein